jgi:hypothetical protein
MRILNWVFPIRAVLTIEMKGYSLSEARSIKRPKKRARNMWKVLSLVGCIMVLGNVIPSFSQSWPAGITPVRGAVTGVSGNVLTVNSPSGSVNIHLGSPLKIYTRTPSDLAHVTSKSFVGVTSVKQPDGSERATEIHIFPEELRGTGEGSYLMNSDQAKNATSSRMTNGTVSDLRMADGSAPRSRMTNGTVSTKSDDGSTLTIKYSGGVGVISVPPIVTVTALRPSADKLKQGQEVLVLAKKQPDGSLTATNIISVGGAK